MRKQRSGGRHKSAIWLAHRQDRHSRGQFLGKRGRCKARTRMRRGGSLGKIPAVEERQIGGRRPIKRGDIDDAAGMLRRYRRSAGQRGNLLKRETGRVPQERRVAHICRSSIPGTASGSQDQNLVPPLKRKICVRSQTSIPVGPFVQYFLSG